MFNWFRKNSNISDFDKFINKFDLELQNILTIVRNCDIVHIKYEGNAISYSFANSFQIISNEYQLLINDKNQGLIIYSENAQNNRRHRYIQAALTEKANQYRNQLAINNEQFNIATINYDFNHDLFYYKLAERLSYSQYNLTDGIAYNLWNNVVDDKSGEKVHYILAKKIFEIMISYYGEQRLLDKIVEVGSNEQ